MAFSADSSTFPHGSACGRLGADHHAPRRPGIPSKNQRASLKANKDSKTPSGVDLSAHGWTIKQTEVLTLHVDAVSNQLKAITLFTWNQIEPECFQMSPGVGVDWRRGVDLRRPLSHDVKHETKISIDFCCCCCCCCCCYCCCCCCCCFWNSFFSFLFFLALFFLLFLLLFCFVLPIDYYGNLCVLKHANGQEK